MNEAAVPAPYSSSCMHCYPHAAGRACGCMAAACNMCAIKSFLRSTSIAICRPFISTALPSGAASVLTTSHCWPITRHYAHPHTYITSPDCRDAPSLVPLHVWGEQPQSSYPQPANRDAITSIYRAYSASCYLN